MSSHNTHTEAAITRRELVAGGASAAVGTMAAGTLASEVASRPSADEPLTIPTNRLGKTAVKVTRLALGAGYPSYHARLLEHAYRNGIRYFDNAYGYGNGGHERVLGGWLKHAKRRGDVFIVTKAGVCSTRDFEKKVIRAKEALQVDTIDMMFIHGIDDPGLPLDRWGSWKRLKTKLIREKHIKFMGFSTHATPMDKRIACVANAAGSGWVDALMVACDPLMLRTDDALNRAIDACVKADVGLVAMKTTRGLGLQAAKRRGLAEGEAETEEMPGFQERGVSGFAAIHQGMWSDGRFAAVCSAMLNRKRIDENTKNAREFNQPLDEERWKQLEEGMRKLTRATCPGCTGACQEAAGTHAKLFDITRYAAYAREDGQKELARSLYARLSPKERDWRGADLDAARKACPWHLDFRSLLHDAHHVLGEPPDHS